MWGFTKTEQNAIIFLLVFFIIGAGFLYYRRHLPPPPPNQDEIARFEAFADSIKSLSQKAAADSLDEKSKAKQKLNVNSASYDELISVKGIGPVTANRILQHRNEKGSFKNIDDLLAVKGIGKKKIEILRERLTTQ